MIKNGKDVAQIIYASLSPFFLLNYLN